MVELVGPEDLEAVGHYFEHVVFSADMPTQVSLSSLGGRIGRVEIVYYNGPVDHQFKPLSQEVVGVKPMPVSEFLQGSDVRPTSRELVQFAQKNDMFFTASGVAGWGIDGHMEPVFGDMSPWQLRFHHDMRQQLPDVSEFIKNKGVNMVERQS
jgi:hypothetical protein